MAWTNSFVRVPLVKNIRPNESAIGTARTNVETQYLLRLYKSMPPVFAKGGGKLQGAFYTPNNVFHRQWFLI
ncbi:MAG: hypothetical protein ACUZ77_07985 [Candidatus Brocadiales bacterium]